MEGWVIFSILACTLTLTAVGGVQGADSLILMETHPDVDIEAIKSLSPSTSKQLYKIKAIPTLNGTKDWKYAILARGNSQSHEELVASVGALDFVASTEVHTIKPDSSLSTGLLNMLIKVAKVVGKLFGTLPKRPLKPYSPPYTTCSAMTVDVPEGSNNFMAISFQKSGDAAAAEKYGKVVMFEVFAALDVSMAYSGTPESTQTFDNFNIQEYGDKKVFCEWALSDMAVKMGPEYMKAIKKQMAFTAVAL